MPISVATSIGRRFRGWYRARAWNRWRMFGAAAMVVVFGALGWAIHVKSNQDWRTARRAFSNVAAADAERSATAIHNKFEQIYQGLRTIGLLPSVRRIDRYGKSLDHDALASIQQLYNNLRANVAISEVYVVPADFNPERIDPATGALEAPILMFDELIEDAGARAREGGEEIEDDHAEAPEVEIFEYRELAKQMAWLRTHASTNEHLNMLERPMLSSSGVITCDNTEFIRTGRDEDRLGVVLSVPFYGEDGALRGTISAIMRTKALGEYLPSADFALVNPSYNLTLESYAGAIAKDSARWIMRGEPDPNLIYSEATIVNAHDPNSKWVLWSGRPNAQFYESAAARSVAAFSIWAYVVLGLMAALALGGLVIAETMAANRRQSMQQKVLEEHADEMRQMAEQQAALKARADQANLHKSQFLANMSHELRTPLNAIIGYCEIIQEDVEELGQPQVLQDLDRVLAAAKHLLSLINAVLDLSKIEAGRVEVEARAFDVDELTAEVVELLRPTAIKKGLQLDLDISMKLGVAFSDQLKIKQCLLNLLTNAIKFTHEGHVRLRGSRAGDMLCFEIEDTGIGLTASQVERLFQPFSQAHSNIAHTYGGTGLGLVITRTMCRLLGGDVSVKSVHGEGSTFTMQVASRVQNQAADTDALDENGEIDPRRPAVLVVDDQKDARDIARRALQRAGFAVRLAATATEGVRIAEEFPLALVCLDLQLPDSSGWDVLQTLQERRPALPVIVVSIDDDRARSIEAGACAHLVKPINRDLFTSAVMRFAQLDAPRADASAPPQSAATG